MDHAARLVRRKKERATPGTGDPPRQQKDFRTGPLAAAMLACAVLLSVRVAASSAPVLARGLPGPAPEGACEGGRVGEAEQRRNLAHPESIDGEVAAGEAG